MSGDIPIEEWMRMDWDERLAASYSPQEWESMRRQIGAEIFRILTQED